MTDNKNNWPGWSLNDNPYGEGFDTQARQRMIDGSLELMLYVGKYKDKLGKNILEVGPFFNPLITSKKFPDKNIFYWENDRYVIDNLKKEFPETFPVYCDLNKIEGDSLSKLKNETLKAFNKTNQKKIKFDSVIISHVFNYIDYVLFMTILKDLMSKDALLFINNVVDYGLEDLYSKQRPRSIRETIESVEKVGFEVLDKKEIETTDKKFQKNNRLILVAKQK